jgi:predicted MPP superfamily phosphohydrolase
LFLVVALFFLFALSSCAGVTFTHFTGVNTGVGQLVALGIPLAFVAAIFGSFRWRHSFWSFAGKVSSVAMGWLNCALLAAVACWITLGLTRLTGRSVDPAQVAWMLFSGSVGLAIYGFIQAGTLCVTRYTVKLPQLSPAWQGQSVALVSDIHVGAIRGPRFVRKIVARLQELQPTAVFISGDMFDGAKVDVPRAVEPWNAFHAPAGTYFVSGNHDEFGDRERYFAEIARVGIKVLHNEKITIDGLQIIGVHDGETHHPDLYRDLLERAQIERGQPSLLLAHHPTHLEIPAAAGVSLQLSGHTHGGQFFPWTLLVWMVFGRFGYGLNRFGPLQVVTSSGAGSGGPPMRIGTRSEIVMLKLEVADEA